jgi:hypothetical protein
LSALIRRFQFGNSGVCVNQVFQQLVVHPHWSCPCWLSVFNRVIICILPETRYDALDFA